ncbi:hypothetical protein SAMN05518800_3199 [Variovorax sp. YR752]|uniref:HEPN domain-containing protein n=1 Tax=Variovorax sp. YR752 TaxID=1884383 RepID=UPI000BC82DBB|nr:HEPN domain-containing protein [Variovorax sp. YR752]SOD27635.1 hypothetical protein SAMN05518800_3199 [Variovorax sp. YR752]
MTTEILPFNSPVWPPSEGGKRLTGKYFQLLENFVGSLTAESTGLLLTPSPEHEALVAGMAKVFWEHLSPEHVEAIIFRQCIYSELDYPDRVGSLAAPENKDMFDSLVGRLKSFFESIPRRYTLRIELPLLVVQSGLTPLAPDIVLVGREEPEGTNKLLDSLTPPAAPTVLEITVSGFGDYSAESPAASAALSVAKQCAFVMQAFNIVKSAYGDNMGDSVYRDSANSVFTNITIPDAVRRSFSRMKLNDSKLVMYDWLKHSNGPLGLLGFGDPGRTPVGAIEERFAQDYLLTDVRRYFLARSDEDFGPIAAAIEWYQDSVWADNDTFAYVAACIGLEAVLGSSDEQLDSLSKRLADRYAFLMGRGRTEREALRATYSDVLKLRGRLVHGKAARLDSKERPLLKKVQDLLLQLLWKEIHRIRPLAPAR